VETIATERPPAFQRLAVASFINQGLVFLAYSFGLLAAFILSTMDQEAAVEQMRASMWLPLDEGTMEQMEASTRMLHEHGIALMSVLLLRTLARFVGVLRMWHRHADGFHVYTSAQLLGILLPMLIVGNEAFTIAGLLAAGLWCMLYYGQRTWWHPSAV
jgi:hypothetical protein